MILVADELLWLPAREKIDTCTSTDPQALIMATHFKYLADAIESVTLEDGTHCSENLSLLLSTCRNEFLTINAIFEDISQIFGHGRKPHLLAHALECLQKDKNEDLTKCLGDVRWLLNEISSKLDVWYKRNLYWKAFLKYLDSEVDRTVSGMIRVLLNNVRVPDGTEDSSVARDYLRIDFDEKPWLDSYFQEIERITGTLSSITELFQVTSSWFTRTAVGSEPVQSTLPLRELGQGREKESIKQERRSTIDRLKIITDLNKKLLNIEVDIDKSGSVVVIRHERDGNTISINIDSEIPNNDQKVAMLELLSFEINRLYSSILNGSFKLNIARTSLPKPFKIDLKPPEPIPSLGLSEVRNRPMSCSLKIVEPEIARIALFDGGIGKGLYNEEKLTYKNVDTTLKVGKFLKNAIALAAEAKAAVIAFPECFIPESSCDEFHKICIEKNIVIIGGVESSWTNEGKRRNRALICIPSDSEPKFQGKQRPSRYEIRMEDFKCDGIVNVYYNTPIGCFAVLICSDLLELDVLWALATSNRMPEIVFVCTMNPHPKMFELIASADAYRLYSYVAQTNNRDFVEDEEKNTPGSIVISPLTPKESCILKEIKTISLDSSPLQSQHPALLRLFELDLNKIRMRSHSKHAIGYCHVPHFRNRIG
jgi:predicted amidohydrolase